MAKNLLTDIAISYCNQYRALCLESTTRSLEGEGRRE
jgi:hypothetical protein